MSVKGVNLQIKKKLIIQKRNSLQHVDLKKERKFAEPYY